MIQKCEICGFEFQQIKGRSVTCGDCGCVKEKMRRTAEVCYLRKQEKKRLKKSDDLV